MPRDFDLSPYFEIVKFHARELDELDYRKLRWEEEPERRAPTPHQGLPKGGGNREPRERV